MWEPEIYECELLEPIIESQIISKKIHLKVFRDDLFHLQVILESDTPINQDLLQLDIKMGGKIVPFTIKGKNESDSNIQIINCIPISRKTESSEDNSYSISIHLECESFLRDTQEPSLYYITNYLNGFPPIGFNNTISSRIKTYHYENERAIDSIHSDLMMNNRSIFHSIDCEEFSFIIHVYHDDNPPKWSKKIGIEWSNRFGKSIDENIILQISEILGFLTGCHLIPINTVAYSSEGKVVFLHMKNHNVRCVDQLCKMKKKSLIPWWEIIRSEEIGQTVSRYLEDREPYKLHFLLASYWIGQRLPRGLDIPIYHSGLDTLANYWLKISGTPTQKHWIPKDKYKEILEEYLPQILEKIKDQQNCHAVKSNIERANEISLSKKIDFLFEGNNLRKSDKENDAIKNRNKVHDISKLSYRNNFDDTVNRSYVYLILINRIILKILGYSGKYFDYSQSGWPLKCIDIPAGE